MNVKEIVRFLVTLATFLIVAWWLFEVSTRIGTAPQTDQDGTVVLDEFQRAKDILIVVLPLFTAALGYWFGSSGKEKAEEKAEKKQEQLEAVSHVNGGADVLEAARSSYPQAFS